MNPVFPISSPPKKDGSYLVLAPQSFPKNSRWMVAQFYTDNQTFYDEGHGEHALPDVVAWTELPPEDEASWGITRQPDMGAVVEAPDPVKLTQWAFNGEYTDLDKEAEAFAANFTTIPNAAARGYYIGWKLALAAIRNGGVR